MKTITSFLLVLTANVAFAQPNYTAHEWGTFTSVQGGNGELLAWRPLQTSELPQFVYDWTKPGLNRVSPRALGGKAGLVELQRMETPVIYFYSADPMNVDVSVSFPKGLITEWYPQAERIGPSAPLDANAASGALAESRAVWKSLSIAPSSGNVPAQELPQDESGSHYFAARETSANLVQTRPAKQNNSTRETEKFIFYRGAGSFKTPLRVTAAASGVVTLENTGAEALSRLFLISIHRGDGSNYGTIAPLKNLAAKSSEHRQRGNNWKHYPLADFQTEIAERMEAALVSQGLFPDEAKAMVNTWKDSWFTEEGTRVLYILPRRWTDEILPLTLNPAPKELVRVMVGRAEIILPDVEQSLSKALADAQGGSPAAREKAVAELKKFGRFAEPAVRLAGSHGANVNLETFGLQLLYGSTPPRASVFE